MQISDLKIAQKPQNSSSIGIILAAGQGKRMNSNLPKVAHTILGKPLITWAGETLYHAGVKNIVVVLSPQQKIVEDIINKWDFPEVKIKIALQEIPQGTGHAVLSALNEVEKLIQENNYSLTNTQVLVAFGDTPAVSIASYSSFINYHISEKNMVTILGFSKENPQGYGRIICDSNGSFVKIQEDKDCSTIEKEVKLCNSGLLCTTYAIMQKYLPLITNNNRSGEYYLTDLPALVHQDGLKVGICKSIPAEELEGVNSQEQLADLAKFLQNKMNTN